MPTLAPFRLERYFARYEFHVAYLLCASDCESVTVADLLALEPDATDRLNRLWLGYTESAGSLALRQAISQVYTTVAPEQTLVFSGAEEAIFLFMHALVGPGDHLVVHWPCYQSLAEVARSLGAEVTPWRGREAEGWRLDVDELRGLLRPTTRAIVLNTPHNPTGYLMRRDDLEAVCALAQERGVVLFSDEVYREAEHDPTSRLPAACDVSSTAVSLGVVSKTYGLPGLRIGWLATQNAPLLARIGALKDYTTICNSAPSELLAEIALRHRQALAARNVAIIRRNLAALDPFFARHADRFAWVRPAAGPIAFPHLLSGDVEDFCHRLVTEAGVLLLPGGVYDDDANHFRIGFGRANMPEAVARLEAWLQEAPPRSNDFSR